MVDSIKTEFNYLRAVASHDLRTLQQNIESGKCILPVLERSWKWKNFAIFLMTDVDGVFTYKTPLPNLYFDYLFRKEKYAKYSGKILQYENQINLSCSGKPFEGIKNNLFKAGLTQEDHEEACEFAGKESEITPYAHEAVKELYEIPPFIGIGFNSTSWLESLASFAKHKKLPISMIEGSWLEFHKKKFTGRSFFNYEINKLRSGMKMLERLNCIPDLKINKKKIEFTTLSDTVNPDRYFTEFVGLGGMSLWMDKNVQKRMQIHQQKPEILEINIPEALDDMKIFTYPIKHLYRSKIITALNSPEELNTASSVVRKLISAGRECLKIEDETLLQEKTRSFIISSQETLALLTKFDFPRYSTGIDFKHLDLLSEKDMKEKKEIISDILGIYSQNFPEGLAEENWLAL